MDTKSVNIVDKTGEIVLFEASNGVDFSIPVGGKTFDSPVRIYVGTSGTLVVKLSGNKTDDDYATFKDVPAGQVFFGKIKSISATSTAADLVIVN